MIIGLLGLRKSGKTTAARFIKQYNSQFIKIAFADQLKEEVATQYSIPVEDLYDNYKKEQYRQLLQNHGMARRQQDPNYWINKCREMLADPAKLICVEDVRYLNEIGELRSLKARLMRIKTNDEVRGKRGWVFDPVADTHPSELELSDIPDKTIIESGGAVINNNLALADLKDGIFQQLVKWGISCEMTGALE